MNVLKTVTIGVLSRILPLRIKNSLFHLAYHLAPEESEKFAYNYSFAPNMRLGLTAMADRGFSPRTIIDVGAFEGSWSKLAMHIWPSSKLFMIEPNWENKGRLAVLAKQLGATLFSELLGQENGLNVEFKVMGSGSSIMEERSTLPRRTEARRLRTLDSLLKDIERPALLKIDAQGYELEILKGASMILPAFEAVLLEVAIIEINEGAPLLHDVVAFMKTRRFVAYDIVEIHRRPLDHALNQVDIVFVSEQSHLIADKRHFA
jgi:FkbM family methyltransferase